MKPILSLFLTLCLMPTVQAEPLDDRHKLAIELVELISINRPVDTAFQQVVIDQIDQVIPQLKLGAKDSELFREAALGTAGRVNADRLIENLAGAYARKLSAEELKGIIEFYKTPAGRAWLRESDAIEAEKTAQKKALIAEVLKETQQRFKELKEQQHR